ncbi:alcohol dehydrogenase catalytic domain-containing protein [Pseudonocardia zijingensis]|uniref:Enoyl reductase (ER) domain-containing protein n=1 Tax=Pseudonocardia zijingensis TaxID=153376 RepID=A0ABN1PSQ5_9PSEU
MKSVVHHQAGDAAAVARVEDRPDAPAPREGEIRVRVTFSPVHRGDLLLAEAAPPAAGHALGTEAAGVVTEVGPSVSAPRVGDRVAVFPAPGAWSEHITVPAEAAVVVPDSVGDVTASVLLVNTLTARDVLRATEEITAAAAAPGDSPLVVTAAASAVGTLIVQQALDRGRPVIAIVRSDRSADVVRANWPDVPVVVSGRDGWQRELERAVHGRAVPVVADAHGGPFVRELLPFLDDGGTVVVWGDLAAQPWTLSTGDLLMRGLMVRAVTILRWPTRPAEVRTADRRAAVEVAVQHPHLFAVGAAYPLDELQVAIAAARGTATGTALLDLK